MGDRRATITQLESIDQVDLADNLEGLPRAPVHITQLAQVLFCGISGYAVNRTSYHLKPIAFGTFTFLLGHGILGLIKYTVSENNKSKLRPVHTFSSFLTRTLPLPLISTQIFLDLHYSNLAAYSHAASTILPMGAFMLQIPHVIIDPLVQLVVLSNAGSLAYISYLNENYWILVLSTATLFMEMGIDYFIDTFSFIPPVDWWTSALGTFVMIAIKALESV